MAQYSCQLCYRRTRQPDGSCGHNFCLACVQSIQGWDFNKTRYRQKQDVCPGCTFKNKHKERTADSVVMADGQNCDDFKRSSPKCDVCVQSGRGDNNIAESVCGSCDLSFCQNCELHHKSTKALESHEVVRIDNLGKLTTTPGLCSKHGNKKSGYFCTACKIDMCSVCILVDHNKHEIYICPVLEKDRFLLKSMIPSLKEKVQKVQKCSDAVKKRAEKFEIEFHESLKALENATENISANNLRKTMFSVLENAVKEKHASMQKISKMSDNLTCFVTTSGNLLEKAATSVSENHSGNYRLHQKMATSIGMMLDFDLETEFENVSESFFDILGIENCPYGKLRQCHLKELEENTSGCFSGNYATAKSEVGDDTKSVTFESVERVKRNLKAQIDDSDSSNILFELNCSENSRNDTGSDIFVPARHKYSGRKMERLPSISEYSPEKFDNTPNFSDSGFSLSKSLPSGEGYSFLSTPVRTRNAKTPDCYRGGVSNSSRVLVEKETQTISVLSETTKPNNRASASEKYSPSLNAEYRRKSSPKTLNQEQPKLTDVTKRKPKLSRSLSLPQTVIKKCQNAPLQRSKSENQTDLKPAGVPVKVEQNDGLKRAKSYTFGGLMLFNVLGHMSKSNKESQKEKEYKNYTSSGYFSMYDN